MTTLKKGGVLQRAVSFISHLESDLSDFQWHLLLSEPVASELQKAGVSINMPVKTYPRSPARSPRLRRLILKDVDAEQPRMLFTFCGPSYLSPQCPELMGVADGWVTHATKDAYASIPSRIDRWLLYLSSSYKRYWFKTAAQYTVQTSTARDGLSRRTNTPREKIHVIPNALANWYREHQYEAKSIDASRRIQIFYFAAAYSHKRHDLLPEFCVQLQRLGLADFQVVVTLPLDCQIWKDVESEAKRLGVSDRITNIGPVAVDRGVELYQQSDICFVPSILETFSATYLEAMATKTPIVACDLDFAREICGDAALYFEPSRADRAAQQVMALAKSPELVQRLREAGVRSLARFPKVDEQMQLYRSVFTKFLETTGGSP